IAEERDLFVRTVGEHTDIVEKEMYSVKSKGREDLVLRPEITAPVVRSYIEHGMSRLPQPQKLYYISQVFRHEKPQAGRFRQFWQIGAEILGGESDPIYDAQIILAAYKIIEEFKLGELMVGINSIGGANDRQNYKKKLVDYYRRHSKEICEDCLRRLKSNPLRVLDCKVKGCQPIKENAPIILDNLSGVSKAHFKQVLEFLEEGGIPYVLKPNLVRGLDYYNRTVFEVFSVEEGQEDLALLGGGRYDYLAEQLGGRSTPGVGMSIGVERVANAIRNKYPDFGSPRGRKEVFLVHVGQLAKKRSISLLEEFRKDGLNVVSNLGKSSLSTQLEAANKAGASFALILGQKEVFEESIIIRDMVSGTQETVPLGKVVGKIKRKL
ncbi:MAG: histidine--tRNA ligase, partial [bacterium]|nr:histidine--tRNA ligase [bacterium]